MTSTSKTASKSESKAPAAESKPSTVFGCLGIVHGQSTVRGVTTDARNIIRHEEITDWEAFLSDYDSQFRNIGEAYSASFYFSENRLALLDLKVTAKEVGTGAQFQSKLSQYRSEVRSLSMEITKLKTEDMPAADVLTDNPQADKAHLPGFRYLYDLTVQVGNEPPATYAIARPINKHPNRQHHAHKSALTHAVKQENLAVRSVSSGIATTRKEVKSLREELKTAQARADRFSEIALKVIRGEISQEEGEQALAALESTSDQTEVVVTEVSKEAREAAKANKPA